jgi:fused signal recognition particle receptor
MALISNITSGLFKTREKLSREVKGILGKGKLTEETLEELEARLIEADICYEVAAEVTDKIRQKCRGNLLSSEKLLQYLEEFTGEFLVDEPELKQINTPHVMLILGVNGVGKTTSIAKLAYFYKNQGKRVLWYMMPIPPLKPGDTRY